MMAFTLVVMAISSDITSNLNSLAEIVCGAKERKEVGGFLAEYISFHVEGLREVRSLRVMESVLA